MIFLKKERKAKRERKSKTPYSPTKIKARNFLSNIAYSRICNGDFSNVSFVAYALVYITMDLKPFFLEMTYFDPKDIEMVKMLWEDFLPKTYLDFLKQPENFELLYSDKLTFKQVKAIIGIYMMHPGAWKDLIAYFHKYHVIYQYVYSHLFPKTFGNKAGLQKKILFSRCLENWSQKKKMESLGKNPFNFAVATAERHPYEQRPITNEIQILDDLEFKADTVDTKKSADILTNPSAGPEGVRPYSSGDPPVANPRFVYAPTMVGIKNFDKKYKLSRQEKASKTKKTTEEIQAEKQKLEEKLAENDQQMNKIKVAKQFVKKNLNFKTKIL